MKQPNEQHESIYLHNLEYDKKLDRSWRAFFIDRVRFLWLILLMIFIAGYLWLRNLPLESTPEVDIGMAYVVTMLPGASPESVEDLVTKKIEKHISKVTGVDKITSTSMNSSSVIIVQFLTGIDTADAVRNLRDKVDDAKPELPEDTKESIIREVSFNDFPIWTFALSGDYEWEEWWFELYEHAKKVRDELEKHPLVSEVTISGGLEREFGVFVDPQKMTQYGVSLSMVNSAIASMNMTMPIGSIDVDSYKKTINLDTRFYTVETLKNIIVTKIGDTGIVYLKDVADVRESPKKITTISRLSVDGQPSFNAITLWVVKKKWGSIVDLVAEGNAVIDDMRQKRIIPPEDTLIKTDILDRSEDIRNDLDHLIRDGIITIILVFVSLFLIIGLKEALVAGTAVPIVFLLTFLVMSIAGQTLNFLSMFALILSLGLLVDDAIVVISAMNQYKKTGKFTTREAAILVIRDYTQVLITTTMTVVFIFGSMLFMTWIMGNFLFSIPFVVSVVLVLSLIVALTLNPALAVMLAGRNKKFVNGQMGFFDKWLISMHALESLYGKTLRKLLQSTATRRFFLFFTLCAFLWALALPIVGILKTEFFPATNENNFTIMVEWEPGETLNITDTTVRKIEKILMTEKQIESFSVSIGVAQSQRGGSSTSEHLATINVKLVDKADREETSADIAERIRQQVKTIAGTMTITVEESSAGPGNGAAVEVKIAGDDFATLERIGNDAKAVLETIPGAIDITLSRQKLPAEFHIDLDINKLALHDLTVPQVASFMKNVIDGTQASKIYIGDEEMIIRTQYEFESVDTMDKIKDIKLTNNRGRDVFLRDIFEQKEKPSVYSITREDQKRVITLTANAAAGANGPAIQAQFKQKMANYPMPSGYGFLEWGQAQEMADSISSLWISMIFGMMLIVALLILLYNSYRQAVLVMITIPLSLIGVFYGLSLLQYPLSFPGMIGMVALFGIVVRNGIILFDKINQNLDEHIPMREAIVDAGVSRLEPVLLTSVCTVLGMIPLTLSNPTWTGLGLAIMCGLSVSTIFTLLVLPTLYFSVFKRKYTDHL